MAEDPTKAALRRELTAALAGDLETVERAHRATREAATHAEAKPENDKDTRALEQTYLARGQAMRVEELRAAVAEVSAMPARPFAEDAPVALGALVEVDEEAGASLLFLAPQGGGARLAAADGEVQVVTPRSPLGRALLGKRAGEECEVRLAGRTRVLAITRVR